MGDRLDIYGEYAEGYAESLQPSTQPHFYHPDGSVTFSRLHVYPEYEMAFDQAIQKSAGNQSFGFDPVAQDLLIKLSWPRMALADKLALETFYNDVARGTVEQWDYTNNFLGPTQPVRFADPSLPVMPEVAYQRYQVALTLRVTLNYPQLDVSGDPPAGLSGNRFVFGSVAMAFPTALKGSGYGLTKLQPLGRDTSGGPVIYDKSRITQREHRLTMPLKHQDFISLQSFFFTYVHGSRHKFTWVDQDEVSRTVRLAGSSISIKQLAYDRFQTELTLLEEIA